MKIVKNYKSIITKLLLFILISNFGVTFAYWATQVSGDAIVSNATVDIGQWAYTNDVLTYRDTYEDVLLLTPLTVAVSDKTDIEEALAAYGVLSASAQSELTTEYDLLISLLEEINAFENSEFLDFEAQAYDSGLTGTVDINDRTWNANDVYISNDTSYDVWNDTRSLALRDDAYFESEDLFINGIDRITLYAGALNYGNSETYEFNILYELDSNPGVWVTLTIDGTITSSTPLGYYDFDINIDEAVNIRFISSISGSSYLNLDDIRIYEHVVESDFEAQTFRTVYAEALALDTTTVELSDKTSVEHALAAYDLLSLDAQNALTAEKALLDNLLIEINIFEDEIDAEEAVAIAENSFSQSDVDDAQVLINALPSGTVKTDLQDRLDNVQDVINEMSVYLISYASTLSLTTQSVQLSDRSNVEAALDAYDLLSSDAQTQLINQKALLDSLIVEINNQTPTETLVDDFRDDHAYVLSLTTVTVEQVDQVAVEAALDDYALLSSSAQSELSSEKALLDSLLLEILESHATNLVITAEGSHLQTDVDQAQIAIDALDNGIVKSDLQDRLDIVQDLIDELLTFRNDYQETLALTTATVTVSDKDDVEEALAGYGILSASAQSELTTEYDLLISLLEEINAFENSEFLDFEAQAYDSGLTGTVDINDRTWNANDVYISNDTSYDVWNDTRSLALRDDAYFESEDLFINGIDRITLYAGALNYGNSETYEFNILYELDSNPGVWVTLTIDGTITSSTPLGYYDFDINIDEAVNIRFISSISGSSYLNLDDIRIYEHVVESEIEAQTYKVVYAEALALDTTTVELSDKTIVDQALAAYDLLSVEAQSTLTSEKTLLDNLLIEIAETEATNYVIAAENSFLQSDVDTAQTFVSALASGSVKTDLQDRLDDVQDVIDEISLYLTSYSTTLSLTIQTVEISDQPDVQTALDAYHLLSVDAKAQLASEKALLDALIVEINSQTPTETQVETFRTDYADVLALTTSTVQVSDQASVEAALDAYDLLSGDAKAELTTEKALLDSLLLKIEELNATDLVIVAEGSNAQADVDLAQTAIDLLPSSTLKTDLQGRIDAVQDIIDLQEANDMIALINAIPSSGEIALSDETQIVDTRNAFNALTLEQQALVSNENVLIQAENELISLQLATDKVVIAEGSLLQADVDDAQVYVTALVNGTPKTTLQNRLDAVQNEIDVLEAQILINNYFDSNTVEVSRYRTNVKETAFLSDANDLVDALGVTITITNTNETGTRNTTYTIIVSKGSASITFDVDVTFIRS
jgi:hypothetical protein